MNSQVRIAVISKTAPGLLQQLQDLPGHPTVEAFPDLFSEAAAIHSFAPRLLVLEYGTQTGEIQSALKILSTLIPDLSTLILCEEAVAASLSQSNQGSAVAVLAHPCAPEQLRQAVSACLGESQGDDSGSYLQFVRGICDEINNPLMFCSGHLQLLQSRLDPNQDRDALAQVQAIRSGLVRIEATMRKVSSMSRAAQGDRLHEEFTLDQLLSKAAEQIQASSLTVEIGCPDSIRPHTLQGDIHVLAGALFSLAQVGLELQPNKPAGLQMQVRKSKTGIEVSMLVDNAQLQAWELPKAFEPYHLNSVLQGTTLGLNLFLVRLVCQAHGGSAIASRLSNTSVEFCINWRDQPESGNPS